jgi:hypothetical protein
MAIKGRDPMRSNIKIKYNVIEQINTSSYLGCSIAYQNTKTLLLQYQNCPR